MEWLAILLLVLGLVLLLIEVFLTGFGFAGAGGIVLLLWSGMLVFTDIETSTQAIAIGLVITLAVFVAILIVFSRLKLWKRIGLPDQQKNSEGYAAPVLEDFLQVGLEGIALTPLRPAGTADFSGIRIDVVTAGDFIEKEQKVKIIKLEGTRVIVESVK